MAGSRKQSLVLGEARRALHMTQAEFARAVGSSYRTVGRCERGQSVLSARDLGVLAALLSPVRRDLAVEVAAHAGQTLESLGLVAAPAVVVAPAPAPTIAVDRRPRTGPEDLIDVVVLAAMLESRAPVDDVRRWLYAVMKRACDVGLTMQEAERALRPRPAATVEPDATAATSAAT